MKASAHPNNDTAYQKHLARMDNGTPLKAACDRVLYGTASELDLIIVACWELEEAVFWLEPMVRKEDQDGFHAGCCASRVKSMLQRLVKK